MQQVRFVILHHEGVADPHFDVMLETEPGSKLAAWRSRQWPIDRPTPMVRIAEHRSEYLDYEGPLSGDRGHVQRVARGWCHIERRDADTFWSIRFIDPPIGPMNLRQVENDQWLAVPVCGA